MRLCDNCRCDLDDDEQGRLCFRCGKLFRSGYLAGRKAAANALMAEGFGNVEYTIARGGEVR